MVGTLVVMSRIREISDSAEHSQLWVEYETPTKCERLLDSDTDY